MSKNRVFFNQPMDEIKQLNGWTLSEATGGINSTETGFMMEFHRTVDNVVLGREIIYDPEDENFSEGCILISQEFVVCIDSEQPNKA